MRVIEERMEICRSCNKHTLQRRNKEKFGAWGWFWFIFLLLITSPIAIVAWPIIFFIVAGEVFFDLFRRGKWICSECNKQAD